jgi:hypothetical protein
MKYEILVEVEKKSASEITNLLSEENGEDDGFSHVGRESV